MAVAANARSAAMPQPKRLSRNVGASASLRNCVHLPNCHTTHSRAISLPDEEVIMAKASDWQATAVLLVLGAISALTLFLLLRPLQLESPASSGARAMLRLDHALGATVEPVDSGLAKRDGLPTGDGFLVITSLASKGPAAAAGLRVGDVIERIDGKPASWPASFNATAPVSVWREGKTATLKVDFAGDAGSRFRGRI